MAALGITYFYACAALSVIGALVVVLNRNPIRGAMGLLLTILSIAGLFLALHAQFLAAVQLIVYAGAIVVLFLFVIMLLGPNASPPRDRRGSIPRTFAGVLFGLASIGGMSLVVRGGKAAIITKPPADFGGIDAFGRMLFSDDIIPFELSSALLMVAVIGAVAVAKGRQGEKAVLPKATEGQVETQATASSGVYSHSPEGHG